MKWPAIVLASGLAAQSGPADPALQWSRGVLEQPPAWYASAAARAIADVVLVYRVETFTRPDGTRDRRTVADPAAPPIRARFYELGTNRPIFLGRDSVVRDAFAEIGQERRNGYAYYATWAASLW
ncbi:MAG TPA: pectate lyase [Vicinamibacterales bacterium]|nr:pectate lyase [Vicinamibacterales bacterium]